MRKIGMKQIEEGNVKRYKCAKGDLSASLDVAHSAAVFGFSNVNHKMVRMYCNRQVF